jgi:hypothetical protein
MVVGRAASCALRLKDRAVSGEHATLAWNGEHWTLRDLGSRNGTFIGEDRLEPGGSRQGQVGMRLGFGSSASGFEVVDAGSPSAVAADGLLALPSPESPELVVYQDGRGAWVVEQDDTVREVVDGETIAVGGRVWRLHVPAALEGTATVDAGPSLDTVRIRFAVSRDEEHVELSILHRGKKNTLEAREHGYILLTRARARLEDADQPLAEQGWLDRERLLKMLGMDANAMNVGIYRARGQLSASGLDGAAGVVEVRRGQRRFGMEPDRFEITSL